MGLVTQNEYTSAGVLIISYQQIFRISLSQMKLKFRRNTIFCLFVTISIACVVFYTTLNEYTSFFTYQIYKIQRNFDINKNVLIFLHMQKTGGSDFDRNIVRHLLIRKENKWEKACLSLFSNTNNLKKTFKKTDKFKKFSCLNDKRDTVNEKNWYFSRQTFGWVCGLHPDLTQLKNCVSTKFYQHIDPENFYYFTILREPLRRFLSEWQHVKRGATWKRKNSKECSSSEYENCIKNGAKTWANVSLDEFISCEKNPAFNRQVKMLANYDSKLNRCNYEKSQDLELLHRAKKNLRSLDFFALNEFQGYSEILFQHSIGKERFKFGKKLEQSNSSLAEMFLQKILYSNKFYIEKIKKLNSLDVQLYEYAFELFFDRMKLLKLI